MTKINKLVMNGFKSFAKNTELVFGDTFNCILGPNGSGKSNVLDALCFVLGKTSAKALRTEKSANLIYNGGKSKKPGKSAEVAIYFDNKSKIFPTEDKEVKISRKVNAKGQSTYRINNEVRTRQQILELMSLARVDPDGYNVILQGDIVKFVEMAPEQRRELVEEISGVSIYEDKKQKAVNELDRVEERLKEAGIVLAERKTHLNELKKERDQATKFKDVNDKIKTNKASLLYKQIDRRNKEKDDHEQKITKQKDSLEAKQKELQSLKDRIKQQRERIDEINKDIEQKGEKEQVDMHKEIEQLKIDLASSKNRIESVKTEISKIKQRKEQLKQNIDDIKGKIKKLDNDKKDIDSQLSQRQKEQEMISKKIEEFKKKNQLDDIGSIEKEIDEIDKLADESQKKIMELRQSQQELLRDKDKTEFQIQAIDEKIEKVLEVEKENKSQIQDLKRMKDEFKKATLELNKRLNNDSEVAAQLGNARTVMLKAQEELSKLETRKMSLKEKIGSESALGKILDQKNKIKGIYGTVSELGKVSSKYSLALEIAAGPKITSVVVQDDKVAAECIRYLKEKRLGIVTFLPLNKIRSSALKPEVQALKSGNGVQGLAIDLISYDPKFKSIFSYVFGNTLIVENIDTARRIGVGKAKMVTLEGDLTEVSGAMQGGYRRKKSSGLGFQEKEIDKEITVAEKLFNDNQMLVSRLEKDRKDNDEMIEKLRTSKAHLEADILKIEKTLNLDSGDTEASKKAKAEFKKKLEDVDKKIDSVTDEISDINKDLMQAKIKKQELRNKVNELRNPALIAELNAFEEKKNELREQIIQREGELKNIDSQIENVYNPELENINKIIAQHDKEDEDFKDELKLLNDNISNMNSELKEKEQKQKNFQTKFKGLFTEKSKIDEVIKKDESKIETISEQARSIEQRINTINIDNAKVSAELAGLQEEYKDYEGVPIVKNKSEQDLRREIGTFEGIITKMGNVNMKSLEIYDHVEKEYGELLKKKEKLSLEKEDVLIMMNEIELKKKELFMDAFEVVNDNFKSIFSALSTKGEASLVLENKESPFDGGLLVKVKLTGTRFMDIRSLSGGEKTMTALAFIFAIQEHEPASFYVLDEVDAALDKKNSEKLSQLIRKYSEKAQYILISHNDGVISDANTLYGVSMDENGRSNVVSLRI